MRHPIAIPLCTYGFWLSAKKTEDHITPNSAVIFPGNVRFFHHTVGLVWGHGHAPSRSRFALGFWLSTKKKRKSHYPQYRGYFRVVMRGLFTTWSTKAMPRPIVIPISASDFL